MIRRSLWGLCALLVVGSIAPFINAARFSGSIRVALETSLGRKVNFDRAYFTLFSGPGFSLENVTISEDTSFGIEPFAFVPVLEARLRLDKLLLGQIRVASLRLVNPSLNLVRRGDGAWNAVALMERLTAPRRLPLNLFPSFEVAGGRIDFKLGTRKTVMYISDSDLSIYPQRSGKVYLRFSGSPSRTDRAGMGFGHFRANVTIFGDGHRSEAEQQVEAELFLDPSNLSELTTLVQGHDVGVHGTVSSHLYIEGPANALKINGELALNQVHRWDLLPSSGEAWTVRYGGDVDLPAHSIDLHTAAPKSGQPEAVVMHLRMNDFLTQPTASVRAELKGAPLRDLLSLASRMGVLVPSQAELRGSVSGAVSYSNRSGWSGGLSIADAEAIVPGTPALHAPAVNATISGDRVHFEPAALSGAGNGSIELSGDYDFSDGHVRASLTASDAPLTELAPLAGSWFGGVGPLSAVKEGMLSGRLLYAHTPAVTGAPAAAEPASYSGQFALADAVVVVPGLPVPLENLRAHVSFRDATVDWDRISASFAGQTLRGSYHSNPLALHAERARIEFAKADLLQLNEALASVHGPVGFWERLRLGKRSLPDWLLHRNLEGELLVDQLTAGGQALGTLRSHFLWQGPKLETDDLSLALKEGAVNGNGSLDLQSGTPHWQFTARASGFPWAGGWLNANGRFGTSGSGADLVRNLTATGDFTGQDLELSTLESFATVSGQFDFSFADGWPNLHLLNVQALQKGQEWTGEGASRDDGRLLLNLVHEGRELHLSGSLVGDSAGAPLSTVPAPSKQALSAVPGLRF